MSLLLAAAINKKIRSDVLEFRDSLRRQHEARWLDDALLCIRLGELDSAMVDRQGEGIRTAMDKAANAHQGFTIELAGVVAERLHGGGAGIVLKVGRRPGMLQSVMESFRDRSPAGVDLTRVDPWKPQLVLAELDRLPGGEDQLKLEASGHGRAISMGVKLLQLRDGDRVLHEATLPSSGG